MKTNLDAYERQMERSAGQFRPVSKKKAQRIEGILQRAKKSRNINIRIKVAFEPTSRSPVPSSLTDAFLFLKVEPYGGIQLRRLKAGK